MLFIESNDEASSYFGRKPWENTMLYYKFTENANDYSWNWRNWTSYETTFSEENGAYFWTALSRIQVPSMNFWTQYTVSVWFKIPNTLTWNQEFDILYAWTASYRNILYWIKPWWLRAWLWNWWTSQSQFDITKHISTWRNNIILVRNWTNQKVYLNKELIWENNASYNPALPWNNTYVFPHASNSTSEYSGLWYMKEYILENAIWTSDDVANYFDKTKRKFWDKLNDFQQVEYVWLSWSQRIEWLRFPVDFKFTINAQFDTTTQYYNVYDTTQEKPMLRVYTNGKFELNIDTQTSAWVIDSSKFINVVSDATWTNNILTIDWTQVAQSTKITSITKDTTLLHRGSSDWFKWKISSIVIENWTTKIRELIPCYRKSDNVIWLFDKENNIFYTNAWSWTFTKWWDIN